MARPLPPQSSRKAPEITAEGLQYRVQKWADDCVMDVGDDLGRFGRVDEDEDGQDYDYLLTTLDGKQFEVSIKTQVEVKQHG